MNHRILLTCSRTLWIFLGVFIVATSLILQGTPAHAEAERIAILKSASIGPYNQAIKAFKSELPIRESQVIEYDLEGDLEGGSDIAQEIIDSEVDLVLAVGLKATLLAQAEIKETPVLFCMVLNPNKFDLGAANLQGISLGIPFKIQFLPLQTIMPTLSRIGVLYDPKKSGEIVKEAQSHAKALGLELIAEEVSEQKELPAALRQLIPRIHALWLLPDSTVLTGDSLDFILKKTLEHRLPVVGFSSGLVKKGALVGTYLNYKDVGKQAALLANSLLNGHSLNGNKIIAPKRYRKAINLNTANFLGLSVSPNALKEFDERY